MSITQDRHICGCDQLEEAARGHCFLIKEPNGAVVPAFAIRFDGRFFAYINRCGHIAVRLDYMPGEFFSDDGQTLMCSTHGAEYSPETGACLGGPCYGIGLDPLNIVEKDGQLYLANLDYQLVQTESPASDQ